MEIKVIVKLNLCPCLDYPFKFFKLSMSIDPRLR
jgi:hypothetical protein